VVVVGHLMVFVIELERSRISIDWAVLSRTAKRLRATKMAAAPVPRLPSDAESRTSLPVSLGRATSSYRPLSAGCAGA
jgi:hypothetical protein